MDRKTLASIAANELEQEGAAFWEIDYKEKPPSVTVRFSRTPDLTDAVKLFMNGDLFFLDLTDEYELLEIEYDDQDKPKLIRDQVKRGLAYVDGQHTEVEVSRGGVAVERRLDFPDGSYAQARVPFSQKLRARFRGPKTERTIPHPRPAADPP